MSASNPVVDRPSANAPVFASGPGRTVSGKMSKMRHELVEAQVDVLRMYMEKKPRDHLLESLDRLIACAQNSFREEEELMEFLTSTPDHAHREMHNSVLAQLGLLRRCAMESDRGRLLAQLILVDRQLTSHISEATQAQH